MDSREIKALIDYGFDRMGIKSQCDLMALSRSTLDFHTVSASDEHLAAMRAFDELYQDPKR